MGRKSEFDSNRWLSDSRYDRRYNRDIKPPAPRTCNLREVMLVMFLAAAATVAVKYYGPTVDVFFKGLFS